jgi:hypothetical protein
MIELNYRSRHAQALRGMVDAAARDTDAYAREVRDWAEAANATARMAGLDADGRTLPDVQRPRRWPGYAGATGPALAPHGPASRSIAGFFAEVARHAGGFVVRCGIRGRGVEVLGYHALGRAGTGRKGQTTGVRRDVLGIPPQYLPELQAINRRHVGRLRRALRAAGRLLGR